MRFPLTIDMMPYTTAAKSPVAAAATNGATAKDKKKKQQLPGPDAVPFIKYELSSVIVHKGDVNTGHYVNYAREGREWFLFDDSKVTMVDESDVLSAEAYLLLYVVSDVTEPRAVSPNVVA